MPADPTATAARQCEQCGRTGTRGFRPIDGLYYPGRAWFVCANNNACRKRWPKPLDVDE